jgi:colanic acid biosynthesis glycosyl transferase WcaI
VFLLAGDGAMRAQLKQRAEALGLADVRFLPVQGRSDFLELLAATDVALIVQQSSVSDIVFPSKTVTLLSAARPVIASVRCDSEIARVVRESGGGLVTEPENAAELSAAIEYLSRGARKRAAMGQAGREYARQQWRETKVLPKFEECLVRISSSAPRTSTAQEPAST